MHYIMIPTPEQKFIGVPISSWKQMCSYLEHMIISCRRKHEITPAVTTIETVPPTVSSSMPQACKSADGCLRSDPKCGLSRTSSNIYSHVATNENNKTLRPTWFPYCRNISQCTEPYWPRHNFLHAQSSKCSIFPVSLANLLFSSPSILPVCTTWHREKINPRVFSPPSNVWWG